MINLGLGRISQLAKHLTPPTWKAIHIAGTNGKGSVAAYLSSLFLRLSQPRTTSNNANNSTSSNESNEIRIGRFTSPHLIDRWDCITINDKTVPESLFLTVEKEIKRLARQVENQNQTPTQDANDQDSKVTEFELLTATAFEIFTRQECQVAVIECGLGGRLDATNILRSEDVAVSVISKIGLDHQGLLGDTVGEIALQKAGIIKTDVPVVVDGTNEDGVKSAIESVAAGAHVSVLYTEAGAGSGFEIENNNKSESESESNGQFAVKLPVHQRQNLALAQLTYLTARQRIPDLELHDFTASILPQVLDDVARSYPGRLQHLRIDAIVPEYSQEILLDGAHNPQSAVILRQYVDENLHGESRRVHWILAVSRGKDASEIFRILLRSESDSFVLCGFGDVDGMPWVRSTDVAELVGLAAPYARDVHGCRDITEALDYVCARQEDPEELVVVAGSLYLVSDLLRLLRNSTSHSRNSMSE